MREGEVTKKPSLKVNFGMNVILTASSVIFPMITFPYLERILMPEGMGKVSFAISIVTYFNMFAQLGIPVYGIRACAKVRDDRKELSRTASELLLLNILTSVISYIVLFAAIFLIPRLRNEKLLFMILCPMIIMDAVGMEWLYKALEKYTFITVRSILFKLISVVAIFLMIHDQKDYVIYAGLYLIASHASNIVNLFFIRKHADPAPCSIKRVLKHLKPVSIFFAMSCATTVYLNLDMVMLGGMVGDTEAGYYDAAVKIKSVLVSMVTALGAVLLPRISYYVEHNETEKFREICTKAYKFVVMAATPLMVYFTIFAPESVLLISGKEFVNSILPMRIIMPTLLFIGITNIIGIQILIPLGKERYVLLSVVAGAVVDLIINLLLIPRFGAAGAATGTVTAEAVVLIVQTVILKKMAKNGENKGFNTDGLIREFMIPGVVIGVVAASLGAIYVKKLGLSNFLTLVVSAVAFFGIYALIVLAIMWVKKPGRRTVGNGMSNDGRLGKIREFIGGSVGDIALYISFAFLYIYRFYLTTEFTVLDEGPVWLRLPSFAGLGVIAVLSVYSLFETFLKSKWKAGVLAFIMAAGFFASIFGGNKEAIVICLLVVAAKDRNIKPMLITALISGSLMMILAYLASMNGYVPYLVYDMGTDMLAHAFGMIYRTDFAAHVLYLVMIYAILRGEKLHLWEYMIFCFDTWVVWRYSKARTDTACLVLFLVVLAVMLLYRRFGGKWVKLPQWTAFIHIVCATTSFILVAFFPTGQIESLNAVNASTLESRFILSREAFKQFPINLFGHKVEEHGNGGFSNTIQSYFYIDISYVRILITCGIMLLVAYLFLITLASYRATKQQQIILALALIIVAIQSMIEQHAFSLAYNVLIICSMGNIGKEFPDKVKEA